MKRFRTTLIVASVLCISCTTVRMYDFTVASSDQVRDHFEVLQRDVRSELCFDMFLFIPWGNVPTRGLHPAPDLAVHAALDQVEGATVLIDATIEASLLFTYIYNRGCVTARGTAARPSARSGGS